MRSSQRNTEGLVRDRYESDGFAIFNEGVLPQAIVAAASEGMDALRDGIYDTGTAPEPSPWNPGDDPHALCKIEQPQRANRAIAALVASSKIGERVAAATGAAMVQAWWVQLLYKPPSAQGASPQTNVGWHRDLTYWKSGWEEGSELLTAWVALSDVLERSGPMRFVVGSHAWSNPGGGDFFSQDIGQDAFQIPEGQVWQETPAVLCPGGMSLHHRLTLHGSGPNTSPHPRRSFAIHLRTENSRPRDGAHKGFAKYLDDPVINPILWGKRVESAFC